MWEYTFLERELLWKRCPRNSQSPVRLVPVGQPLTSAPSGLDSNDRDYCRFMNPNRTCSLYHKRIESRERYSASNIGLETLIAGGILFPEGALETACHRKEKQILSVGFSFLMTLSLIRAPFPLVSSCRLSDPVKCRQE